MAPRRPRKNDEAVESLIRNPSSKTDFRSIGNQQVRVNLMLPGLKGSKNVKPCHLLRQRGSFEVLNSKVELYVYLYNIYSSGGRKKLEVFNIGFTLDINDLFCSSVSTDGRNSIISLAFGSCIYTFLRLPMFSKICLSI